MRGSFEWAIKGKEDFLSISGCAHNANPWNGGARSHSNLSIQPCELKKPNKKKWRGWGGERLMADPENFIKCFTERKMISKRKPHLRLG